MIDRQGTLLPNATRVSLRVGQSHQSTLKTPGGVYLWPNGWLTVYESVDVNRGTIFPPHRVLAVEFGEEGSA